MDSFIDSIIEILADVFGDMFADRTGRRRQRRRVGPRWTTVPELRDLPVAQARATLARAGLRIAVVQVTAGADAATAPIIGQDPPPWQAARRRHRVTVRV